MFKKTLTIFKRDLHVSYRDFMSLFMIVIPIILAFAVNAFAPGIEDTTVNLVFIEGENTETIAYLEDFAKITKVKDYDSLEKRVLRRDNIVGFVGEGEDAYILTQGNEPEDVVMFAKLLKTYSEYDRKVEDSTAIIKDFGVKTSPTKILWANMGILLTSLLAGMLISLNIVEEKMDNTISAINVAPISRTAWIFGKSIMGILVALIGCSAMVLILGLAGTVNFLQLLIFVFVSSLISIMIGFLEGVNSDDVMTAVASTKMVMLPLAASVAGYEFLSAKWQWVMYWSPFYWVYKGNLSILNGDFTWLELLWHSAIVLGIAALVFAYVAPRIRKGLEN
ncbi:MAG: ABC transporter permease [Clostridiales bacterium]|nr:ABC transporter permease [Clostridiales bacterium]